MIMKLKKRPGPKGAVEPVKNKYSVYRYKMDRSGGIVTTSWTARPNNLGSIPVSGKTLFFSPQRPGKFWGIPNGYRGLFTWR
jgi:hypothetical protein